MGFSTNKWIRFLRIVKTNGHYLTTKFDFFFSFSNCKWSATQNSVKNTQEKMVDVYAKLESSTIEATIMHSFENFKIFFLKKVRSTSQVANISIAQLIRTYTRNQEIRSSNSSTLISLNSSLSNVRDMIWVSYFLWHYNHKYICHE